MTDTKRKKKVVILGGGLGSVTTAYWLTNWDGWDDEYEVTLYQIGWRLGGKGASARSSRPGFGHRIEEHGLHIWFGFYDNGFRTMQDALGKLRELDPPPVDTFSTWTEAFEPHSLVSFADDYGDAWSRWTMLVPPNHAQPGVGPVADMWSVLTDMIGWMREEVDRFFDGSAHSPESLATAAREPRWKLPSWAAHLEEKADATLLHRAHRIAAAMPADHASHPAEHHSFLADLIRAFLDGLWLLLKDHLDDADVRRFFILADLAGSGAVGILRDQLLSRGFESADGDDLREWLGKQGAREVTCWSPPVATVYDLVFGFERGDTNSPNFAAGTAVRGILRMMFTYKGALMYKMMSGMGDTIFTPLYGILRARGVKIEFFSKVEEVRLDKSDPGAVGEIEISRQVDLAPGVTDYWPFVKVAGKDCWPDRPNIEQIENGEALLDDPFNPGRPYDLESWYTSWKNVGSQTLERGVDFDIVVQGLSIGALPYVCKELIEANADWKAMVDSVATTQTQGAQLWMTPTSEQLGWETPGWAIDFENQWGSKIGLSPLLGGYAQALDTWADMSHLLPEEDWPPSSKPGSVQYLCGPFKDAEGAHPFTDHAFPRQQYERLLGEGIAWIEANAGYMWPNGTTPQAPTGLDPALLVDPAGGTGEARLRAQFWRCNIDPTERYVLTVKGSTEHRIPGSKSGFDNVYLTGDWTLNGVLNAGCVEATVASGMEAARAICGHPGTIAGESS